MLIKGVNNMKKKTIVISTLLTITILMIMPSISAVETQVIEKQVKENDVDTLCGPILRRIIFIILIIKLYKRISWRIDKIQDRFHNISENIEELIEKIHDKIQGFTHRESNQLPEGDIDRTFLLYDLLHLLQ